METELFGHMKYRIKSVIIKFWKIYYISQCQVMVQNNDLKLQVTEKYRVKQYLQRKYKKKNQGTLYKPRKTHEILIVIRLEKTKDGQRTTTTLQYTEEKTRTLLKREGEQTNRPQRVERQTGQSYRNIVYLGFCTSNTGQFRTSKGEVYHVMDWSGNRGIVPTHTF